MSGFMRSVLVRCGRCGYGLGYERVEAGEKPLPRRCEDQAACTERVAAVANYWGGRTTAPREEWIEAVKHGAR